MSDDDDAPGASLQCGTYAGAATHKRHGEPLCDRCRAAVRDYMTAYRASRPDVRERQAALARARARALQRLALLHRRQLAALIREERQKEEALR